MALATTIPIHHSQLVHWVRTTRSNESHETTAEAGGSCESRSVRDTSGEYTLLELVEAIADVTDDEREIVATVIHLLVSGQVRLCGNFRDEPVEVFLAS